MFCKMCILENLVKQKKQKEMELKRYLKVEDEKQKQQQKDQQQKMVEKIEKFEHVEMHVPETKISNKDFKYSELDEVDRDNMQFIEKYQEQKKGEAQ